jgi:hypothetical protein
MNNIDIDSEYLKQMKSYKYLESTENQYNLFGEEITGRISLGNRANYAKKNYLKAVSFKVGHIKVTLDCNGTCDH